ncbi:hypothetical protein LH435_10600 [Laribacter hongkongensis]|uniref:hypothetical protein n=1 Tax=Laribacter hongkongensis TaxID=168471 RepID=UPI001EFC6EEC|nr:hypothetical protein [Laribacter hongkongensis]MCG8996164.1 hypothetical protein [Laribacter hongkongensis]MCG9011083.1 hypothetical protein [Laribacter hongkongensis]MCG9048190.1 hypothetical protein [Laribacter hongkongensis]MCG9074438.1 hypothetical protein [Laribacter hongkongensis]
MCAALEIEHRQTKLRTLQTNWMVECFNGRISEVLAAHQFGSGLDLLTTLECYVLLYDQRLLQLELLTKPLNEA